MVTTHITVEAEVCATNECIKIILQLRHILQDLNLDKILTQYLINFFNNNKASINWFKNKLIKVCDIYKCVKT